jgi:periplasmic protein TonB
MKSDVTLSAVLAAGLHLAVLFGIDAGGMRNGSPAPEEIQWVEIELDEFPPASEPMELALDEPIADGPPIEEVADVPPDAAPEPDPLETEYASAQVEPEPLLEPEFPVEPELLAEETPLLEEPISPPPHINLPAPEPAAPRPPVVSAEPAIGPSIAGGVAVSHAEYVRLTQPNYRKQAKRYYPALARQRRETGVVILTLFINPIGKAERIEVKESSGYPLLDQAARDMAGRSDYMPAFAGSRPVPSIAEASYAFKLD